MGFSANFEEDLACWASPCSNLELFLGFCSGQEINIASFPIYPSIMQ